MKIWPFLLEKSTIPDKKKKKKKKKKKEKEIALR
jgi:hypothetical protein